MKVSHWLRVAASVWRSAVCFQVLRLLCQGHIVWEVQHTHTPPRESRQGSGQHSVATTGSRGRRGKREGKEGGEINSHLWIVIDSLSSIREGGQYIFQQRNDQIYVPTRTHLLPYCPVPTFDRAVRYSTRITPWNQASTAEKDIDTSWPSITQRKDFWTVNFELFLISDAGGDDKLLI